MHCIANKYNNVTDNEYSYYTLYLNVDLSLKTCRTLVVGTN